jgi:hypothetical protein
MVGYEFTNGNEPVFFEKWGQSLLGLFGENEG